MRHYPQVPPGGDLAGIAARRDGGGHRHGAALLSDPGDAVRAKLYTTTTPLAPVLPLSEGKRRHQVVWARADAVEEPVQEQAEDAALPAAACTPTRPCRMDRAG